jgi:hypothetical protein
MKNNNFMSLVNFKRFRAKVNLMNLPIDHMMLYEIYNCTFI